MVDIAALRAEALTLMDKGEFQLRSCWHCNSAHDHLKSSRSVIRCFACGCVYLRGEHICDPVDHPREGDE